MPTPTVTPIATNTPERTATPIATVAKTEAGKNLSPISHMWQTLNNCGPAAVAMALSYYGYEKTQGEVAQVLRPNPQSRGMSATGIPPYVGQLGLAAVIKINGNLNLLKALVSNNVPVIVSQLVKPDDTIRHYRLVRGYDDAAGVVIVNDSLLGPNYLIPYDQFVSIWRVLNYRYIPVYRPADEAVIRSIIGADWDNSVMYNRAVQEASRAVEKQPDDGYLWYDLGEDYFNLKNYQKASEAWEKGLQLGLPDSMFWIYWRLASAYNQMGRFDSALKLLAQIPSGEIGYGRLYYERAEAHKGLKQRDQAIADYKAALELDPTLKEAKDALAALTGG